MSKLLMKIRYTGAGEGDGEAHPSPAPPPAAATTTTTPSRPTSRSSVPLPIITFGYGSPDQCRRSFYGRGDLQVLASNNPKCVLDEAQVPEFDPPDKYLHPLRRLQPCDSAFITTYENDIHPAIVQGLQALPGPVAFEGIIVPVRMSWSSEPEERFLVILALWLPAHYQPKVREDDTAFAKAVCEVITGAVQKGRGGIQSVYIDICRPSSKAADIRCQRVSRFTYQDYSHMYEDPAPLPGSSISAGAGAVGSLWGYLRHNNEIYALTNYHVVKEAFSEVYDCRRVLSTDEQKKVMSPATSDHEENLETLLAEGDLAATKLAEEYNCELGNIVAISGCSKPAEGDSRLDWALIRCDISSQRDIDTFKNQHRVGRRIRDVLNVSNQKRLSSQTDIIREWISKFCNTILQSPLFRGISTAGLLPAPSVGKLSFGTVSTPVQPHNFYFKPASARSGFTFGTFNDVRSTLFNGDWGITHEHTLVSLTPGMPVSTRGDSGSPILDTEGKFVAMMWGGHTYKNTYEVIEDLTFVTPIQSVLRDIEACMEWDEGSLQRESKGLFATESLANRH